MDSDHDSDAPDREPMILNCWSDEEDELFNDERFHQILMNQTRSIAAVALESYYKKEGVQYVLDQPLTSFCFLLEGVLVCHANFTAKIEKLDDDGTNASDSSSSDSSLANSTPEKDKLDVVVDYGNASGSSSESSLDSPTAPASELFFAETAQVLGRNVKVTCCDILNPSAGPDAVRDGCLYCGSRNPIFYHPHGSTWKYGYQTAFN